MVPVAAKAGVLLAVVAAGSTSVWYFSDSIFGASLSSVADESDQKPYQANSIGKKYGKYFLSSKTNKKIWEERYEKNKSKFAGENNTDTKAKDKFSTVASAFSTEAETNNTTSLNKICDAAYKETTSTNLVDIEPSTDGSTKFFKPNVWEFCGLGKIVTLDKDAGNYPTTTYGTDKIGGTDTEKKLFVSTKKEDNDWFWDLKTKEFWSGTPSLQGTDKTNNEFKKLKEEIGKKGTSIKAACEEAYKKTASEDTNNKNKDDALVFCSIKLTVGTAG